MFTIAPQRPQKYTVQEEISYLLDKQDALRETLDHYNNKASDFEDKRDNFFKRLYHRNQIKELKEAVQVFDRIAYVETDQPDFIFVEVTDIYDAIPIVEDEYNIIEKEDLVDEVIKVEADKVVEKETVATKKLDKKTVQRILKDCTASKDDLFKSALKNVKRHVLFEISDKSIILNNIQFRLMFLNDNIVDIIDYSDELFEIMKEHYSKNDIVTTLGIKPTICENKKQIVCTWA